MTAWHLEALATAAPVPYWLDRPDAPPPTPSLVGAAEADLLIVGGGFTGLWAAIQALEDDPSRDVVVLEGDRVGWGASGRNGGFLEASITHGEENGRSRWPEEFATLHRLGAENYAGLKAALDRYGIECGFEETGVIAVAGASTRSAGSRTGRPRPPPSATRRSGSTATRCARKWTRRRTSAGSGGRPATRSSIPRGWRSG